MRVWIVFSLFWVIQSCEVDTPRLNQLEGSAFGTTYTILYYDGDHEDLTACIDSTISAINRSVSTYVPGSDISRINRGEASIVVDKTFKDVFELSAKVHQESQGYFDPTVGILRNAYGFGEEAPISNLDARILDSLMRFVGFNKVRLSSSGTIVKELPEIYLDFNAVAKGYGIDRIGDCLDGMGVNDYLIELGGELLARGRNLQNDKMWTVGIEEVGSDRDSRSYSAVVTLSDAAMASSGNYRKFRIDSVTGKKYVHTINPKDGTAEANNVTSATVIAPDCATADAYATAIMAMGLQRAKKLLLKKPEIEAYITWIDVSGVPQVFTTPGFKLLLSK